MSKDNRQLWHELITTPPESKLSLKLHKKRIRDNDRFADPNPITERINWRFHLNRLFYETIRNQTPGSNLPSVFSESERERLGIFFTLNASFNTQEEVNATGKICSMEKGEEIYQNQFENFLYERLIGEASYGVDMVPYTEKLPLRYGEIALRQEACKHGFELFKFNSTECQYHSDYKETGGKNWFNVTMFILIPAVKNPTHIIQIHHGHNLYWPNDTPDRHRWYANVFKVPDIDAARWHFKHMVEFGECRVTFLDPPKLHDDGTPVF